MQSLRSKVMSPEKMRRLYAELLLYPEDDLDNSYADLDGGEEKEVWLMSRFNILRSQASTLRAFLDLEAKKAYAQLDKLYVVRKQEFDGRELLARGFAEDAFKYYRVEELTDFLNWYLGVIQDATTALDVKPSGFDSDKLQIGEHFWDNMNERGTHPILLCGASSLLMLYQQFSGKDYRTHHPVLFSFQVGHSHYKQMLDALKGNTHNKNNHRAASTRARGKNFGRENGVGASLLS